MNEKDLKGKIVDILKSQDREKLSTLKLENNYKDLKELIFGFSYDVLEDTSDWRTNKDNFSIDIIGGMTPDIVIRVFPPTLFVSFLLKFPDRFKKEFNTY